MKLTAARLAEIAVINPAIASESTGADEPVAFVPMSAVSADPAMVTVSETRAFSSVQNGFSYFQDGDILVAKITPCFENGKIAQARIQQRHGFGSTEFHVVRASESHADSRFLLHFLRQDQIRLEGQRKMTGSAGQRRVPKHFLESLEIPLPPLAEQRRIAAILDQAEALRAKRRHALAQLGPLTRSLFLEMFGDPVRHGWPEKSVAALASNIRTGPFGSQLLHSEFVGSGIAVLGIDNAVQNQFVWGRPRFITEYKFRQLKRYQVSPGDVLITIMGTCGRCAVVPDDIPTAINTKHLCCITLDRTQCLSTYLHACFLLHPHVLYRLGIRERGAVMPGLNMQIIKELVIPVPPLPLQREFAAQVSAVERLKATQRASLAKLDALFASLQHRAFRGEL